ncbi:MAG: hypothetical protein ACLPKE_22765 [Streptosporangiaceae bacterium]
MLPLVAAGVRGLPAALEQRDAERQEDDPAEVDPVPGLPLARGFGGLLLRGRVGTEMGQGLRGDLGQAVSYAA